MTRRLNVQTRRLPTVPEALLKKLDALYPERCPDADWTDRKVWIEGRRAERSPLPVGRVQTRTERETPSMCQAAPPKPPASPQTNAAILAATGQVPIRSRTRRRSSSRTTRPGTHHGPSDDAQHPRPHRHRNQPGERRGDVLQRPADDAEGLDWVLPTVLPGSPGPQPDPPKLKGFREWNGKVQGIPLFRGAVANDSQLDPLVLDQRKGLPSGIGFSQLRRDLTFPTGGVNE
jgi:hypothetical protein